jgi:alpha-glucosidase
MLRFTRQCLELRRRAPALRYGLMKVIEAGEALLVFERSAEGQKMRCSFNLSDRALPFTATGLELIRAGHVDAASLGPYAAVIEEVE